MSEHETELIIEAQDGTSTALPTSGKLVLGSSPERADFVVPGQGVEDAHCAIGRLKDGGYAIKDLGSQFGTFVNGKKVDGTRVSAGDRIVLGGASLRVVDPSAPKPAAAPAPAATPPPAKAAGVERRLGGFRIERVLGRGGMGEVLLAVQESLNRHVALKVLSPQLAADREFVLRFHSEARAAAALSHPNVVVVHDVGEENEHHFLVMEFMPGGSLEERIARDGLVPWREALDVLHDAASGLSYAEAQGIVHRDIKPANLMIAGSGATKIADLGLATAVSDLGEGDQAEGRKTFGTPHFISPEQARGSAVDHRSDLYSLGATAYRLLTGRTPFVGATAKEIVRARFQSDPASLRDHVPAIPAELDALVLRLMAREPRDRFPTADSLLREVDRIRLQVDHGVGLGTDPIAAPAAPKRSPVLLGALVVAVLGVVALAVQLFGGADDGGADPKQSPQVAGGASSDDPRDDPGDDPSFFGDPEEGRAKTANEEAALRRLEQEAATALARIPAEYSEEDRLAALRDIVERFGPTNVARQAKGEIDAAETAALDERVRNARLDREIADAIARLESAVGWPPADTTEIPKIATYVQRVFDYQVSMAIATSPTFIAQRTALVDRMIAWTEERARAELARADALANTGSFAEIRARLDEVAPNLRLPEPRDDEPAGYDRLRDLLSEMRARASNLERDRESFQLAQEQGDRDAFARALGAKSAFRADLAALRIEPLSTRLAALVDALQIEENRALATRLRTRVDMARAALDLLASTYRANAWRRKSVSVPDGRRSTSGDVVGVQPDGVLVARDGGAQLVPWSTFALDRDGLAGLFRGRISRDYTPAEHASILSLLTLASIARALEPASHTLSPTEQSVFDPQAFATMNAAFDGATAWAAGEALQAGAPQGPIATAVAELERERDANAMLASALAASEVDEWTRAVSTLEYLLAEYADTLSILLVSDGTYVAEPLPPAPDESVVDGAAENPAGDASAPTTEDKPPKSDDSGAETGN